jgi:hypothetical protein
MRDEAGRKILCGKCGSGTIYWDAVPGIDVGLACLICGNREGSKFGFKKQGDQMTQSGQGQIRTDQNRGKPNTRNHTAARQKDLPKNKSYKKIQPCVNCGRNLTHHGRGMCGGCYCVWKTTPEEKRTEALAVFAKRVNSLVASDKRQISKRKSINNEDMLGDFIDECCILEPGTKAKSTESFDEGLKVTARIEAATQAYFAPVITLNFEGDDKAIYDSLCILAKRLRRDPEQQAMWMLQTLLDREAPS